MSFYAGTNVQGGPFTFHIGKAFDFSLQNMSAPLVPGIDYSIGTITQAEAARNYLRVTDRIDEAYSTGLGLDEFRARVQIASNVSTELLKLNWLQVLSLTKLSEIDEAKGNEFESEMTLLLGLIT